MSQVNTPSDLLRPRVSQQPAADGGRSVALRGAWNLRGLQSDFDALAAELTQLGQDQAVHWDLLRVDTLDAAGAAMVWRAWGRQRRAGALLRPEHEPLFQHLAEAEPPSPRGAIQAPLRLLGVVVLGVADHARDALLLIGGLLIDSLALLRRPSLMPWREVSANVYRTGTQALGITALVGFLVGVVLSYLSSQQLKLFGADIFIINILGISVIRELGPVLATILVAGRSGSSMTAQLGVMRVTQELDAMAVMGIPHTTRLIFPKILALSISLPLLVLWTNAIAMIGGMVSAQIELGIGFRYFASSLPDAVPIANLWLGIAKGAVFGMLIALVACHFGLRIRPNTESLGEGTTNSVVTAITVVILVDAVFAVVFSDVGIQQ